MTNKKVNFFIIGAPKCGTTALAAYLNEHRDIFILDPKEPHYFATDLENYRYVKKIEEYNRLFKTSKREQVIGEGSVFYLYSKEAIENIKNYNKDAKIIIMLRNPVEMVPSLHSELISSADENILDFEEAWFSSESRKRGENISKHTRGSRILYYDEIAKYFEQLKNVRIFFPDDQIKIILFDDFKKETQAVYEDVLQFLNICQDGKIDFPVINENKKLISHSLNIFLRKFPKSIILIYLKSKELLGFNSNLGLINKLVNLNTKKNRRKELTEKMKKEIKDNYREDVLKLSSLLKRDLTNWIQ